MDGLVKGLCNRRVGIGSLVRIMLFCTCCRILKVVQEADFLLMFWTLSDVQVFFFVFCFCFVLESLRQGKIFSFIRW
jgi:hypothetical protein